MSLRTSISSPTNPKVVRFQINYNLRSLFLSYANERDRNSYEDFLCYFKSLGKEIRDDDLVQFLKEARGCISILSAKFKLFVELILIYQWAHRSQEVISEYQGFLLDLCSAHCDYAKPVIDHLVNYFKTDLSDWADNWPGETSKEGFKNVHDVIKSILSVIPMSRDILIGSLKNFYPYLKRPATEQQSYVYNLLQIIQYEPSLQLEIFNIIVDKLIILDSHCPREELEKRLDKENRMMDVEGEGVFQMDDTAPDTISQMGDSLDASLFVLYKFVWIQSHDENEKLVPGRIQLFYRDIVKVFDRAILQTHNTNHVQFIVFYLLSLRPALGPIFIEGLWSKVSDVNIPPVIRQAAVSYMASFITRATFLPLIIVKETISLMAKWIHAYINSEDCSNKILQHDTRIHGVFYTSCQALFYIIAFRHKDLIQGSGLNHLQSLSLSKIVTCRLNPLRVCFPVVVSNFSSVARAYQLAYCNTVIERNSRSTLPTVYHTGQGMLSGLSLPHLDPFFPFDPYLLKRSKVYIALVYREYSGTIESRQPVREEEEDDFLNTPPTPSDHLFSYSTSPGFIHI